jgi:glyceraldehyde-3-phosphate dehydrogenase/erythrose-4-phosphate dehydrogenase
MGRSAAFNLVTPGTTAAPAAKYKIPELKDRIGKALESGTNGNTTDGYVVTLMATVQQIMTVLKTAET